MEERKLSEDFYADPPFVFNASELGEVCKKINQEKEDIDEILKLVPNMDLELLKIERKQVCFNGLSAYLVENPEEVKNIPPAKQKMYKKAENIIKGYIGAESFMLMQLEKEPYIWPDLIKALHCNMFMNNKDMEYQAKNEYRCCDMIDTGWNLYAVGSGQIADAMALVFSNCAWVNDKLSTEERFEQIAKLHAQIVRIQPFVDGNKRTAFLATNAMLKLYGYPIIDVCKDKEESAEYKTRLGRAMEDRDVTGLAKWLAEKVEKQQSSIIKIAQADAIEEMYEKSREEDIQKQ